MKIIQTHIPDLIVFEPRVFGDERGFFLETFRQDILEEAGIKEQFVQDNHSRSSKGVLRGLHYQLQRPQGKLVRVTSGEVFDVAVDIRVGSPTFGAWYGIVLNEASKRMMYVPPGFAHGFCVLSNSADFLYKCTDYYNPKDEQGIFWNDTEVGIDWPEYDVLLSEKDQRNPLLKDQIEALLPQYNKAK